HQAVEHELAAFHNCVQACLPGMVAKKAGKIIVISTRLAQQPLPRMGAYAAAKSALESMADTMAIELGPLGISVNVVTPAFTLTDASMIMPEAYRERVRETRPLKKHLYPEDIAGAVAFLAGDESSMLTGSHILITGGSHLQLLTGSPFETNYFFRVTRVRFMLSLDQIVEKLAEIVGPRFVSTNPIDKINYQHTLAYGAYRALPDVIVRVESDARGNHSVAKILRFANEHKIPI